MASNTADVSIPNENAKEEVRTDAAAAAQPAEMTPMTDWYNPWQLIDTAKKTTISTIIGENADPRTVTAAVPDGQFFDYSEEFDKDFKKSGTPRREIWIDYVSDVGDGWNPTYSVAYTLARETLDMGGDKLNRGEILLFGGDGVYPTANWEDYDKKLVKPYAMAFNSSRGGDSSDKSDLKKNPHLFVLPGNHDWYDSLVAFQNLFCTHIFNKRLFAGGWQTRQERSYFALKLPHKWWLLGVDLQLSHNIDARQLQYFESLVEKGHIKAGDKVILCVPEPYWVKTIKYHEFDEAAKKFENKEKSIEKLECLLREKFPDNPIEIKVYLAGDLHHYRRFESEDGRRIQKITAGGGGAFLHPTHDYDFEKAFAGKKLSADDYTVEKQYPEPDVSRSMDWANLYKFIFNSPYFGVLTAILYILLALLIHGEIKGAFSWRQAFKATIDRLIGEPLALLVVVLLVLALIFFTDSNSKIYKRVGGAIHGLTHLSAVFFLGWLSYLLSQWINARYVTGGETARNLVWFATVVVICGVGGYLIGAFIMGVYLFVSLHFFGRHDNEAFSAMKIEDYKNFVRMHIDANGDLAIYPVKIERVARRWDYVKNGRYGYYEPQVPLKPELIEEIKPVG